MTIAKPWDAPISKEEALKKELVELALNVYEDLTVEELQGLTLREAFHSRMIAGRPEQ